MKTISIVVPCYNEEENVEALADALREMFGTSLPSYEYEIIFIDNDSKDKTREIIRRLAAEDRNIKGIFNAKNFGQFNSPYYGLLQSGGDCAVLIAADFQDPVEMIPKYVKEWENGYKIVIGIKKSSKENPVMYWLRGCDYKMIRALSDVEQIAAQIMMMEYGVIHHMHSSGEYVKMMAGKVWLVEMPAEELVEYQKQTVISNVVAKDRLMEVRVIAESRPADDAVQAVPNLEDAYLYIFNFLPKKVGR